MEGTSAYSDGPSGSTGPNGGGGTDEGGTFNPGDAGAATPNGVSAGSVVLVHASRNLPAFRACFSGYTNTLPLPDDKLMPNANVVGVDVGTAVHVGQINHKKAGMDTVDADVPDYDSGVEGGVDAGPALQGPLWIIEEKLARQFYPQGTDRSGWPNCDEIVKVLQENGYEGHGLYTLTGDPLSPSDSNATFVVVKGCLPDSTLTTTECGSTFTKSKGNLSFQLLVTTAQDGMGFDFEGVAASPAVPNGTLLTYSVSNGATPTPGVPIEAMGISPSASSTLPTNSGDFDMASFELRDSKNTLILQQSLAAIQARSSPRVLPADFFGLRSTFVLFAVGDPTVADKTAPTALHFLAVPVQDPGMIDPEGGAL